MKELIKKILEKWACKHKWDVYYTSRSYGWSSNELPTKIERTLICKECGKIKKISV